MKKMKKAVLAVLAAAMLLLSGCSDRLQAIIGNNEPAETTDVVFLVGANRSFLNINYSQFRDIVYDAAYTYGEAHAIVVDGAPRLSLSYTYNEPSKRITEFKRQQIAEECTSTFLRKCKSLAAQTAEVDTLAALNLAADILHDSDADRKILIVADSFLCTTGYLNYAKHDMFNADHAVLIEYLVAESVMPELEGVVMEVYGIGQTSAEQTRLTEGAKNKHVQLWEKLLNETKAKVNIHEKPLGGTEPSADLPSCSKIIMTDVIEDPFPDGIMTETIYVFREGVRFKPDSAILVDPEEARETLAPLVEEMQTYEDRSFSLFGSCASVGTREGCDALSLDRARACRDLLVEMGADSDRLLVFGLGRRECFLRKPDLEGGYLDPVNAALNRAIFIVLRNTADAEQLEAIAVHE